MTSLVEELENDPVVKSTAPMVKTGKKWNPQDAFNMHTVHYSKGISGWKTRIWAR